MPKVNKTAQAMLEKKSGIDRVTPCTLPSSTTPSAAATPFKASVPEINNDNSRNTSPSGLPQIPEEMSQHLSASQFLTTSKAIESPASKQFQQASSQPHPPRVITGYISKPSPSFSSRGGYSASEALQMREIIQARQNIAAGGKGGGGNSGGDPKGAGGLAAASATRAKATQVAAQGVAHTNMHDLVQLRKDAIAKQKQEEKAANEAALREKALAKNASSNGSSSRSNQRNLFGFFSSLRGGKKNQHSETSQTSMTPTVTTDASFSEL